MADSTPAAATGGQPEIMIRAEALTRYFGPLAAVADVSFEIKRGEVVAFLGPNGAGKSTTMRMLTGFMSPTSGHAEIAGIDVQDRRIEAVARIGYLPAGGPLYNDMTARSLLGFLGNARGLSGNHLEQRMHAVVDRCAIAPVLDKPIGKLSTGYRQRVGMAQAILHEPEVLILDEPTNGLDPNQIHEVRGLIRDLGQTNTILLSTHILQEVEAVADRVIFIHQGRIVFDGDLDAFQDGAASLDERFRSITAA